MNTQKSIGPSCVNKNTGKGRYSYSSCHSISVISQVFSFSIGNSYNYPLFVNCIIFPACLINLHSAATPKMSPPLSSTSFLIRVGTDRTPPSSILFVIATYSFLCRQGLFISQWSDCLDSGVVVRQLFILWFRLFCRGIILLPTGY